MTVGAVAAAATLAGELFSHECGYLINPILELVNNWLWGFELPAASVSKLVTSFGFPRKLFWSSEGRKSRNEKENEHTERHFLNKT